MLTKPVGALAGDESANGKQFCLTFLLLQGDCLFIVEDVENESSSVRKIFSSHLQGDRTGRYL